ncbi:YrhK family protein [Picrophilus oshimae]|uniref:YrhK-like protein n=1 Tax=Picrophilus torridus (strain ATCC 700027 / DSM 9790 / JCM 10055 / NBRC 100828 / KAW 2/3) TaxID=1122961 RepID=A0A8G2L7G4_PICTO|nr:YrhK family protein [Picrophilus oshimae]SMD31092.1 YrhK-like protein [Picrophilus oshimae DSM 9789]
MDDITNQIIKIIKNGYYTYNLKVSDIMGMVSSITGMDRDLILQENKWSMDQSIYSIEYKNVDITIFKLIISYFKGNPFINDLMILSYYDRKLSMIILDIIKQNDYRIGENDIRAALPVLSNSDFLNSEELADYYNDLNLSFSPANYKDYIQMDWFIDLIIMLKDGLYGSNYNYIEYLQSSIKESFYLGVLELIKKQMLAGLVINIRSFLNTGWVNKKLYEYSLKIKKREKLSSFYSMLSIGNDIMIGLEFIIGSFEFLPAGNYILGVYLFIAGSSQLLIRPGITIARNIHLNMIHRKKIRI